MAVYERFTTSNGVRIALDDAYIAGKTPAQLRAAANELNRVSRELCVKAAKRMALEAPGQDRAGGAERSAT